MEEIIKEIEWVRLELRQEFLLQQVCVEPLEAHVSPAPKSTKGSFVALTTSGEDIIGQMSQYELLVEDEFFPQMVAIGKVYQEATTLHNVTLSPDLVKVTVERVQVADAHVPLPSDEVTIVVDAFQTFVA